jgi:hypothetical protein
MLADMLLLAAVVVLEAQAIKVALTDRVNMCLDCSLLEALAYIMIGQVVVYIIAEEEEALGHHLLVALVVLVELATIMEAATEAGVNLSEELLV